MKKEIIVYPLGDSGPWRFRENLDGKDKGPYSHPFARKDGAKRGAERHRRHLKNSRNVKIIVKDRE